MMLLVREGEREKIRGREGEASLAPEKAETHRLHACGRHTQRSSGTPGYRGISGRRTEHRLFRRETADDKDRACFCGCIKAGDGVYIAGVVLMRFRACPTNSKKRAPKSGT